MHAHSISCTKLWFDSDMCCVKSHKSDFVFCPFSVRCGYDIVANQMTNPSGRACDRHAAAGKHRFISILMRTSSAHDSCDLRVWLCVSVCVLHNRKSCAPGWKWHIFSLRCGVCVFVCVFACVSWTLCKLTAHTCTNTLAFFTFSAVPPSGA